MSGADTPSEADVIRMFLAEFAGNLHTCLPGYVLSYSRATQTADVQPAVRGRMQAADGSISEVDLPPLRGVPVAFPSGASFAMTFDLTAGDPVVVMFAERAIDIWKGNQPGRVVGTTDPRRFDLSDAYCIPGGRPPSAPLAATDYAAGAAVLRSSDVRLGSSAATKHVALGEDVVSALNTLIDVFNTHTHVYAPGSGTPVPTAPPVGQQTTVTGTLGAAKVRAE